jgi:hypothetical protein
MSGIEILFQQPWVTRAGWTLVHFLWQGSAIAILLAAVRASAVRWLTARARYGLSCAALALMVVAPLATFLASGNPGAAALPRPVWPVAGGETWERVLPWFVVVWLTGVTVFSARIAAGWRVASRLRRVAAGPVPGEWQQALDELVRRMRVSAPVRLLGSALAPAPAVVGWLRPVILMPIEAVAGLPIEQVRANPLLKPAVGRRNRLPHNMAQPNLDAYWDLRRTADEANDSGAHNQRGTPVCGRMPRPSRGHSGGHVG